MNLEKYVFQAKIWQIFVRKRYKMSSGKSKVSADELDG